MSVPDWMIDTPSPSVDDMAALIRRLVRSLRKAAPGHALANQALDYLARVGMTGDVLREAALPATTQAQEALNVPEDCPHIIVYDDADRRPEHFAGHGARAGALARFKQISWQWNAHLYVRERKNTKDNADSYSSLVDTLAAPTQADSAPGDEAQVLADGDYMRLAQEAGAVVPPGYAPAPPVFPSWGAWGRFCDALRAAQG